MNINKFTIKSQEVIQTAQNITQSMGNQAIETGHLLQSVIQVDETVTPFLLKKLGVNLQSFKNAIKSIVSSYAKVEGGNMYLSNDASKALNEAENKANKSKDEFTSIEHILFALLIGNDQVSRMMRI
jgi:ATP-dependent Clp protease ATP-binding subunit ClpB